MENVPHLPIVSRDEWLAQRKELLAAEKRLTQQYDAVNPRQDEVDLGIGEVQQFSEKRRCNEIHEPQTKARRCCQIIFCQT